MGKLDRLRRIEQRATVARGTAAQSAVSAAAAPPPASSTSSGVLVGLPLSDGTVLIGDTADQAQEQTVSGDATLNRLGVLTLADTATARSNLGVGTANSPTFAAATLASTSNQLVLGSTRTLTLTAPTPAGSSRTLTLPDPGGNDSVVYLALAQTLANKTLTTPTIASFANATHTHANAAGGGTVALADTTGTLAVARGGTGQTSYTDGQLLIGNTTGNTLTKATLTQGTGVTVTNGGGSITIAIGQSVATSATPTFAGMTISGTSGNVLVVDTTALVVDATNNRVGIRTASPSHALHVQDSVSGTFVRAMIENTNTTAESSAQIMARAESGNIYFLGQAYADASVLSSSVTGVSRSALVVFESGGAAKNFLFHHGGTAGDFIFAVNATVRARITQAGSFVLNNGALATTATDGFFYIPTCAGAPTGVPTAHTGRVAVVFDTTNNRWYVYDGGWIQVGLA